MRHETIEEQHIAGAHRHRQAFAARDGIIGNLKAIATLSMRERPMPVTRNDLERAVIGPTSHSGIHAAIRTLAQPRFSCF